MKTVLHLIETGGTGGAETVYLNLIRGLDPSRWRSVAVVPTRGWVYDRLVEGGLEPVVLNDRRAFDPAFVARLVSLVRRRRVDLVQAHLFGSTVRAGLLSSLCGIPAVGTLHGEIDLDPNERYRRLKVGLANRLRRLVYVSEPLRRSFLRTTPLRPELATVIPNGIDTARFAPRRDPAFRAELGIGPDEFVVGAVGNLSPAKGYDVLLGAAALLKARGERLRFVIVGEGKDSSLRELAALRDALGLEREVVFTGFRSDVDRAMAAFDLYVLTSRTEGFSIAAVEAMASELPVVATRCGGPEQILEHGVTGVLVANGAVAEVADAIARLRADAAGRRRLGRAARAVARVRFTVEAQVGAYERLYEECLRPAARPPRRPPPGDPTGARVLVTDGDQRPALAAVRSLGRAGYRVHVVAPRRGSLAGASRYCAGESVLPDPLRAPAAFAAALSELSRRLETDAVLPVSEAALLAVLPRRDSVHGAIPFATAERFERICDKRLVLQAAAACGIATPAQRIAASAGEGAALADLLAYPVVLKPSRSVSTAPAGGVMAGALHATDRGEFRRALLRIPASAFPVLVQARVVGPGTGVFVLLWRGEVLAAFAHRRLREKPPSGGVSVLSESVPLDPGLLARSVALLRALEWEGVAMVEYKVDAATGTPYLMEINGRLWGSLQLPIDAGVDFPVLLVDAALGRTPAPVTEYRVGVRSRWEWGDVDHLLTRLRHSRGSLALPPGAPGRLRVVADFVRGFGPNNRSEVLRRGDLRPFLRESADWLRRR